ncbi:nitrous oxide-stimulated promoter family protein [Sulfurimonas sp.]|uniref:nitrous oxide-stimulated promoter family protein n=1 Tax=Sulfurimonas sp. TaxID=2022749 RepID=UPI0025F0B230|nr:nitrous oxide-stimulated promoter family protein [Sulfurimonas sp.]
MTEEKFIHDSHTVLKFIKCYCDNEHFQSEKRTDSIKLNYNDKDLNLEMPYHLCARCEETLLYSYVKLQECPHDEKPSCRKCPKPCYDKPQWKHLAKIMRFSGIRFGILKIKKKIFDRFKKSA